MKGLIAVPFVVAIAAGCAIGNKHGYAGTADFGVQGARAVAVATQDLRPYVVAKEKTPDFVGLQRGGFGNPFDITTESGKALAEDFSATIARSLERKGFKSTVVVVAGQADADPRALVQRAGAERLAMVTIREWKTDTYQNTGLYYDLTLRVFDSAGAELASNTVNGSDDLGGSFMNPPAHAKSAVPVAFQKKLEQLFATESVSASLR